MSDLDEKLKEIELDRDEFESINYSYVRLSDAQILYVKQAFIDAGWIDPKPFQEASDALNSAPVPKVSRIVGLLIPDGYMTGQEWHDRFEKELDKVPMHIDTKRVGKWMVIRAAKEAAGLE